MATPLQRFIMAQEPNGFFLTEATIRQLVAIDRLAQVLVRCGGCRFVCAVQDVAHLEHCISAGGDYVRDVSFTATDTEKARAAVTAESHWLQAKGATHATKPRTAAPRFNEADCGGSFDGVSVHSDTEWDAPGF